MTPVARERMLLALLAALTLLPLLGSRDLWHSDEPRYAQVAREIATSGDGVVMHLNGEVYREKPPLLFWLQALFARIGGGDVGPITARLPAALAGIAGVLLLHAWARRLGLAAHAPLAAALLATSFGWWWLAQRCAFDVLMATALLAAFLCDEIAAERGAAGRRGAERAWRIGFAACLGLAFLTKGPPALLFGLLGKTIRMATQRTWRWRPGSAALQLAGFAAVVAVWLAPLWLRLGWDDLLANFTRQTAGRMSEAAPHSQPPWYYLATLPVDALPWSAAWLLALVAAWRERRRVPPGTAADVRAADGRRFLVWFVLVLLLVFSAIRGKRGLYLVPLLPALALLTALAMARWAGSAEAARRKTKRWILASAIALPLGGWFALRALDRGFTLGSIVVESRSPRPLGAAVAAALAPGERVVALDLRHPDSLRWYLETELTQRAASDASARALLASALPLIVLDAPKDPARFAASSAAGQLRELAATGGARLLIVTEPPVAALAATLFARGATVVATVRSDGRDYSLLRPD